MLINMLLNLEWSIPAWILLGLHAWLGISLRWFAGALLLWILRALAGMWIVGWAAECGSQKALNLVLLGMLSRHLPFDESAWQEAIAACVPQKTLETNLAAFSRGRALHA